MKFPPKIIHDNGVYKFDADRKIYRQDRMKRVYFVLDFSKCTVYRGHLNYHKIKVNRRSPIVCPSFVTDHNCVVRKGAFHVEPSGVRTFDIRVGGTLETSIKTFKNGKFNINDLDIRIRPQTSLQIYLNNPHNEPQRRVEAHLDVSKMLTYLQVIKILRVGNKSERAKRLLG